MSDECKLEEKLLNLVLNELEPEEKARIREHVDSCSHCKEIYSDLKLGVEKYHAAYPELPDAPKKLSQKRYEEILKIAKEVGVGTSVVQRIVKAGGHAIHLFWSEEKIDNPIHKQLISPPWSYSFSEIKTSPQMKLIYFKLIGD